jgi:hypothetical protein
MQMQQDAREVICCVECSNHMFKLYQVSIESASVASSETELKEDKAALVTFIDAAGISVADASKKYPFISGTSQFTLACFLSLEGWMKQSSSKRKKRQHGCKGARP